MHAWQCQRAHNDTLHSNVRGAPTVYLRGRVEQGAQGVHILYDVYQWAVSGACMNNFAFTLIGSDWLALVHLGLRRRRADCVGPITACDVRTLFRFL